MLVTDLNQDQLYELKEAYFDQLLNEGIDLLDGITEATKIPNDIIYNHYDGINFYVDDFFCSAID